MKWGHSLKEYVLKATGRKYISPLTRRRFISKIGRTVIGITGTYLGARRFYGQFLAGLGGLHFIPYMGKDRQFHLQIRRPNEEEARPSDKFSGFILSINYIELAAWIYHYRMGPQYLYKPRQPRHIFFMDMNDYLMAEISRTFIERMDLRPFAFKCLLHKEGVQLTVRNKNPFKDENIPNTLKKGRQDFIKRSPRKISEFTGYRFAPSKNQ